MKRFHNIHVMLFLVFVPLSQASGSFFDRTVLKTEGKIVDGTVEDLNDDGLLDILAVYTTGHHPHTRRWLAVFYQKEARIFDPSPNQIWEVDPRAAVLDVGDISSDPGQEIVFLTGDGVNFYLQREGTFATESRRLIETETIFALAEEEDLPTWNFARDICPDEGDEVLVSGFGEIELWCREGDAYQLQQTFPVKTSARVYAETPGENYSYSLRADYRVPRIDSKDFNNDDRTDLIVCWEDNVDVFLQKLDGAFPSTPDHELRMKLRTEEEIENNEVDLLVSINDLNDDGQMDVVANKMKGGLANARTQTSFYMGQVGGTFPETPDLMMTADDAVSEPYIIDLDGDNRFDLIQPEVKMGIKSVVSMLLMKKFDINFLVYLNREDGLFPEEPDFSTKVDFQIDFTQHGGRASPLIEFEGDYNNDGRKDLAVGTKEDELSIFFGDKYKVFTKKPQVQETVKTSSSVVAKDFDGDGKTELLLYYPDEKEINNHIIIFWPK
jgi:hypothetical protein